MPPHLDEKTSAAPDFSPGIVRDDERILRALFNPEHIRDGKPLPRAIPVSDLRQRGFSVHRISYTTADFVQAAIDRTLSRTRRGAPWSDEGVAVMHTAQIRSLQLDEQRVFVVIDTAFPDNPAHASIYAAQPDRGEAHARELRALLLPFLQRRFSVSEAFNPQTHNP